MADNGNAAGAASTAAELANLKECYKALRTTSARSETRDRTRGRFREPADLATAPKEITWMYKHLKEIYGDVETARLTLIDATKNSPELAVVAIDLLRTVRRLELLRASLEAGCKVNQFHVHVADVYADSFISQLVDMSEDITSGKKRLYDLDLEAYKAAVKEVKERKGVSPLLEQRADGQSGPKRYRQQQPQHQQQQPQRHYYQQQQQGYGGQGGHGGYGGYGSQGSYGGNGGCGGYGKGPMQPQGFRSGPPMHGRSKFGPGH